MQIHALSLRVTNAIMLGVGEEDREAKAKVCI